MPSTLIKCYGSEVEKKGAHSGQPFASETVVTCYI